MVMGIPKDLYVTDKGADDNALTMPILPNRNHKKQTFQHFFGSTMALMTFLQRTTKIFLLIHSRHMMHYMRMKKNEPINFACHVNSRHIGTNLFVCCCGDIAITQMFFRCPTRR
jgi:hypothetical protein